MSATREAAQDAHPGSDADVRIAASPGLGADELARLRAKTVAVIGIGVLGGAVAQHLTMLGIGQILIDDGAVETVNLGNQGFAAADVGARKVAARRRALAALRPDCPIGTVDAAIEDLGLAALAHVDLLVTGLDSRRARMRVAEISVRLGIPWVDAGVDGSGRWLLGRVDLYDPRRPDAACMVCRFDARDLAAIAAEGRPPGCPSWRRSPSVAAPTLQASPFGAIVAGHQTMLALRVLLGTEAGLASHQIVVSWNRVPEVRCIELARNARCLFEHARCAPLLPFGGTTVGDLFAAAQRELGDMPDALELHGRTLALDLACARCGERRAIARVAEALRDADLRCTCGADAEMEPVALVDRLRAREVVARAEVALAALGLPPADVVTARAGARAAHFVVAGDADRLATEV